MRCRCGGWPGSGCETVSLAWPGLAERLRRSQSRRRDRVLFLRTNRTCSRHIAANSDRMSPQPAIPDDEMAAFLAAPTPRRMVSPAIHRAALRQSAPWIVTLFGAFFGCFGMLFVWFFTPWNYLQDVRLNDAATVSGRVESVSESNMSINKVKVMRYTFSFQPPSNRQFQGECFTTGFRWHVGEKVTVRYLAKNPAVSRIEGARLSEGSLVLLLTWIFPFVGFTVAGWTLLARRRTIALLERGTVAEALVTSVEPTRTQINRQRVYAIALSRGGGKTVVLRRHQANIVALARERLESEKPVFVLFDPANPKRTMLPEAW